jgi:hypothetical protein
MDVRNLKLWEKLTPDILADILAVFSDVWSCKKVILV